MTFLPNRKKSSLFSGIQLFLFLLICLSLLLASCEHEKQLRIDVEAPAGFSGKLSLVAPLTEEVLAELSPGSSEEMLLPLKEATTASLRLSNAEEGYLVTLFPRKHLQVNIEADSSISTNSRGDSLLNYL